MSRGESERDTPRISDSVLRRLQAIAADAAGDDRGADDRGAGDASVSDGRYRLLEEIGRGGMGIVYLAEDIELGRQVALKVLRAPGPAPAALARLRREARILASLEHPGIVPVHDAGVLPDGRPFYVMKRVEGTRLDARVRRGIEMAEALRIFGRICEAVSAAHAHGVLHRDLKPENVMVGPFGEVLVMDWGLAKRRSTAMPVPGADEASLAPSAVQGPAEGETVETVQGTVMGTPGYMPPEQALGEVAALDERTDVYALGGILHFLLTGRPPAPAAAAATSPPPRALRLPGIPRPLAAICAQALAPDPARRYAGVAALAEDIASYLARQPVHAYPENLWRRAARLAARYRTPLILIVAYLAMRLALLAFVRR